MRLGRELRTKKRIAPVTEQRVHGFGKRHTIRWKWPNYSMALGPRVSIRWRAIWLKTRGLMGDERLPRSYNYPMHLTNY